MLIDTLIITQARYQMCYDVKTYNNLKTLKTCNSLKDYDNGFLELQMQYMSLMNCAIKVEVISQNLRQLWQTPGKQAEGQSKAIS